MAYTAFHREQDALLATLTQLATGGVKISKEAAEPIAEAVASSPKVQKVLRTTVTRPILNKIKKAPSDFGLVAEALIRGQGILASELSVKQQSRRLQEFQRKMIYKQSVDVLRSHGEPGANMADDLGKAFGPLKEGEHPDRLRTFRELSQKLVRILGPK